MSKICDVKTCFLNSLCLLHKKFLSLAIWCQSSIYCYGKPCQSIAGVSGGAMGEIDPYYCQDGARGFLKIDEKIGGGVGF